MLIIPSSLEIITTLKDGTIKLTFETQEMRPSDVGVLFSYRKSLGYLAFKNEQFTEDQINLVETLKCDDFDDNKSPSKRMRNVLYRLWQQNNYGYDDFNVFYIYRMNNLIGILKNEFEK